MKKRCFFSAFVLCAAAVCAQYTRLHDFDSVTGSIPRGSLFSDGTFLYGITEYGGTGSCFKGCGTIYKVKPDGTGFAKILDFNGTNGQWPYGGLISDGTFLYGTTSAGGANNNGVVFKIKPDGTGYVKLLDFAILNGNNPWGKLYYDGTWLYGTTANGGSNNLGKLFKIKPDGTGYTGLIDFAGTSNGSAPYEGVISDGTYLYGMTELGGTNNMGTIYKIKTDGTSYSKLFDFSGTADGNGPTGSLAYDGSFLYGMTLTGGSNNLGVAFKIKTDGSAYSKLIDFNYANGGNPTCAFLFDGSSSLYGTAWQGNGNWGLIFKIKTDGTGFTDLYDFDIPSGADPFGTLISEGTSLYGITEQGGSDGKGVVYKFTEIVGIEENNKAEPLDIHPNPVSSKAVFTLKAGQTLSQFKLFDAKGKELEKDILRPLPAGNGGRLSYMLYCDDLPAGIYFYQALYEGGKPVKGKLIIE